MRNRKLLAAAGMTAALFTGAVVGVTLGNPLTSGAQDGSTTTTAPANPGKGGPDGHRGPGGPHGGVDLEVAAKTLKLTTAELRKQLQSGKSLAAIAKAQGVAKQDLIDALVAAGEARLDEAKKNLPDVIAKVVDATPPTREPDGPDGPDGMGRGDHRGPFGGLDAVAKVLGMKVDDLHTALHDGKTLAEIATSKGVSKQKVIDALAGEAKTRLDGAVKAGKLTEADADKRLTEITKAITSFVEDGMGPRGPMGGPGGGMPGGGMPGGGMHSGDMPGGGGHPGGN